MSPRLTLLIVTSVMPAQIPLRSRGDGRIQTQA